MNPSETADVARAGVSVELHTHRHRVSVNREKFVREIDENRARIHAITGAAPRHFCYPGGFHLPQFPGWLRESNVISATTCASGLAAPSTDAMLLPRMVDTCWQTDTEFYAWIGGLAPLLPHRAYPMSEGQLMEDDPA